MSGETIGRVPGGLGFPEGAERDAWLARVAEQTLRSYTGPLPDLAGRERWAQNGITCHRTARLAATVCGIMLAELSPASVAALVVRWPAKKRDNLRVLLDLLESQGGIS